MKREREKGRHKKSNESSEGSTIGRRGADRAGFK